MHSTVDTYSEQSLDLRDSSCLEFIDFIEFSWVVLLNYYAYSEEKSTLFFQSNGDIYKFEFTPKPNEKIFTSFKRYNVKKKYATLVRDMDFNKNGIYLLNANALPENRYSEFSDMRLSLYLDHPKARLFYHKDFFCDQISGQIICKLKNIALFVAKSMSKSIINIPLQASPSSPSEIKIMNNFFSDLDPDACSQNRIIQNIYEFSEKKSDHIAIKYKNKSISYKQMFIYSAQLENYLSSAGIKNGDRVALLLDRSDLFVIAMVSLIRLGASFVPIDTKTPKTRISYILNDSNVTAIVFNKHSKDIDFGSAIPFNIDCCELSDSENFYRPHQTDQANLELEAYVIYTSGSTGTPKGVSISNRSLEFYTNVARHMYKICRSDIVLQFSSIAFDAMIEEVFPTLISGATLIIRDEASVNCFDSVLEFIQNNQVTVLNMPTSYWKGLIRHENLKGKIPASVRICIIGGESVSRSYICEWKNLFPKNPRLVNTYGPTETTVVTSMHFIDDKILSCECSIGKPIPGSKIYIVDKYGNIAPIGASGKIFIGGPGVSKGYIKKQEINAFKNLPNCGDEIFYDSGDFGRYTFDGYIEYLGRSDNQVKVSGYRINTDEIKKHIFEFDTEILDVLILNIKNNAFINSSRIVSFICSHKKIDSLQLKNFLEDRLPAYMIPAIFVLDMFPKLTNGKTDRSSLISMYNTYIESIEDSDFTESQNKISKIWQEILQVRVDDLNTTFTDYGGSSIDVANLLLEINEQFSSALTLRHIFRRPLTVENMAEDIFPSSHLNSGSLLSFDPHQEEKALTSIINWRNQESEIHIEKTSFDTALNPSKGSRVILLTGATGFLGIHLLSELLMSPETDYVYCLVRCKDVETPLERIMKQALLYCLEIDQEKIIAIKADIGKNHFGLSESEYMDLRKIPFTIFHCAAQVNMLLDYESLKSANVDATKRIVKFASAGAKKIIHYISSLAIFDCSPGLLDVNNMTPIDSVNNLEGGYAISKWVSDKIILNSRKLGIESYIYRCGRVWGSKKSGVMPVNDFIWKFISGCIYSGFAPEIDFSLDAVPVCELSKMIHSLGFNDNIDSNKIFHLSNPNRLQVKDIFKFLMRHGFDLEIKKYQDWTRIMSNQLADKGVNHPISQISFILNDMNYERWVDSYFESDITNEYLRKLGIRHTEISDSLLLKYFQKHFESISMSELI